MRLLRSATVRRLNALLQSNKLAILSVTALAGLLLQAGDVYLKVNEGSVSNSGGFTTKAANWNPEEAPDGYPENDYFVEKGYTFHGTPNVGSARVNCTQLYHFKGHSLTITKGIFLLSTQGNVNKDGTQYEDPVMQFDNGPLNLIEGKMTSYFKTSNALRAWCYWDVDINVLSPATAPFVIGNAGLDKNWALDCKFDGTLTGAADTGLTVGYSAPTSTLLATYFVMSDTASYKGSMDICRYSKVTFNQCRMNTLVLSNDATFVLSEAGEANTVGTLRCAADSTLVVSQFGSTVLTVTNAVELADGGRLTIDATDAPQWWEAVDANPTVTGAKKYPFLKLTSKAAQNPIAAADINLLLPDSFYAALGDRKFEIVREATADGFTFSAVVTREHPVFLHNSGTAAWNTCDFVNAAAWNLASGQTFVSGDTEAAQDYAYIVSKGSCRAGVTTYTLYMHGVYFMNNRSLIVDSAKPIYPNKGLVFDGGCSLLNWASTTRWLYGRVEIRGTCDNPVKVEQSKVDATVLGMNFGAGTLVGGTSAALSLGGNGGAEGCVMSARFETLENYRGAILVTKPYAVVLGDTASAGLNALTVDSAISAQLQSSSATNTVRVGDLALSAETVIEPTATTSAMSKLVVTNSLSYSGKINITMPAVVPSPTKSQRSFTVLSLPSKYETLTLSDFNIDESAVASASLLSRRVWEFEKASDGSVELRYAYPLNGFMVIFR